MPVIADDAQTVNRRIKVDAEEDSRQRDVHLRFKCGDGKLVAGGEKITCAEMK